MRIEAVYPKPELSRRDGNHKIYPYLLRGVNIERPDHVWSTDITYIRVANGFVYLTAVIDWFADMYYHGDLVTVLKTHFVSKLLKRR